MRHIVFLLEEPSAKAMLEGLLPRIMPPETIWKFIAFEGKQDLEKNFFRKVRGYLIPESVFIVIRDQDSGDCRLIKIRLKGLCEEAGRPDALIRIACRELESWYLADFSALAAAYKKPALLRLGDRARYRNPDKVISSSRELKTLIPEYQKIEGSRRMGVHLDVENVRSRSFALLIRTLRGIH
ncbi:MAG TPA: DUF4276 family protein [Magnetospirillaceae bacterium]|nr:DUF4276 family protein [Magnetospirillaceae bacterium]